MSWPQGAFTAQRRPLLPRQLKVIVNHPKPSPPTLIAITLPLAIHTNILSDLLVSFFSTFFNLLYMPAVLYLK